MSDIRYNIRIVLVKAMTCDLKIDPYNDFDSGGELEKARKKTASTEDETFGRRLARLRKEAGYSQRALGAEIGISQRMVAYYEGQTTRPPAHLLAAIADALSLSVDQILGHKPVTVRKAPVNQRLLRELRRVEKLPARARRSVLEHIDGLVAKYAAQG